MNAEAKRLWRESVNNCDELITLDTGLDEGRIKSALFVTKAGEYYVITEDGKRMPLTPLEADAYMSVIVPRQEALSDIRWGRPEWRSGCV